MGPTIAPKQEILSAFFVPWQRMGLLGVSQEALRSAPERTADLQDPSGRDGTDCQMNSAELGASKWGSLSWF